MPSRNRNRAFKAFLRGAGVAVAVSLLMVLLRAVDVTPLPLLRNATFDLAQRLVPREPVDSDVVIVEIDDASIAAIGPWPWRRSTLAEIVTRIGRHEPAAIALDVGLSESERTLPGAGAAGSASSVGAQRAEEEALAKALRDTPSVLAAMVTPGAGTPASPSRVGPAPGTIQVQRGTDPTLRRYPSATRNPEPLDRASGRVGSSAMLFESDGIVRRLPAAMRIGDALWPSLAVEAVRAASNSGTTALEGYFGGLARMVLGERRIDVDAGGHVWLRFTDLMAFARVSAMDILSDSGDLQVLRGRVALIGVTAGGLTNRFQTADGASLNAVEVQAQFIDNLLRGAQLRRPHPAAAFDFMIAALACLALVLIRPQHRGAWAQLAAAMVALLVIAACFYAFVGHNLLLDPTYALLWMIAVYALLRLTRGNEAQLVRRRRRSDVGAAPDGSGENGPAPADSGRGASLSARSGAALSPIGSASQQIAGQLVEVAERRIDLVDLEAGRANLTETQFDVGEALNQSVDTALVSFAGRDSPRLRIQSDIVLPDLFADRQMFLQSVSSVLSHVLERTPSTGFVRVGGRKNAGGEFVLLVENAPDREADFGKPHEGGDPLEPRLAFAQAAMTLHQGRFVIDASESGLINAALIYPATRLRPSGMSPRTSLQRST